MLMSVGRFTIDPARRTAFQAFIEQMIEETRAAPGCLSFGVYEDVAVPNQFVMLEQWVDQDLLEQHILTPSYDEQEERLLAFVVGEPSWDDYEFEI